MDFYSFDAEYLGRLAAGDPEIVQHFHDYFRELVSIKVRSRRYPVHAIDDIRQETFVRVLRALRRGDIREPERIGAFVNSVCNFVILEFGRTGARHPSFDQDPPDLPDEKADSERTLEIREQQELVRSVLSEMSARNRRLLSAIFLDERSGDEVCRELGVDPSYLRVLLFRARAQFRDALARRDAAQKEKRARRGTSPAAR